MSAEPLHPLDPRRKRGPKAAEHHPAARPKRKLSGKPKLSGRSGAGRRRARRRALAAESAGPPPGMVRIQKVLAEAGLASRRACEEMVLAGRVHVNGEPVKRLPWFVDPVQDDVRVDGQPVRQRSAKRVYVLLNKPKGVVSTNLDPHGRRRVVDLVPHVKERVFPVGRLDEDSTGLIILTNDGDLANRIAHPRYGVRKTYIVEVEGELSGQAVEQFKAGMFLDGKRTSAATVKVLQRAREGTVVEVRLNEGRNREVRRMMAQLGHEVRALRRVAIGPITDRGLKPGQSRALTEEEVKVLYGLTEPK